MFRETGFNPLVKERPMRAYPLTLTASALLAVAFLSSVGAQEDEPEEAPEQFNVKFETSKGGFEVEVRRSWSPHGADRFYELVKSGFYDEARFFRVVPGFMVQFGIAGDPEVQAKWRQKTIRDDRVTQSNRKGYVTFAKTGQPNSRTTQIFINYADNRFLDQDGFAPFGRVVEGMDVVEEINAEYAEEPSQELIQRRGNDYLKREFPRLDYVKKATIIDPEGREKKKNAR
jgi:cyclophilin family peptidyl-prolyl cis-trans isomerase